MEMAGRLEQALNRFEERLAEFEDRIREDQESRETLDARISEIEQRIVHLDENLSELPSIEELRLKIGTLQDSVPDFNEAVDYIKRQERLTMLADAREGIARSTQQEYAF
jgi:chromosome segregation ATPase